MRLWTQSSTLNNCAATYAIRAWANDRFGPGHVRIAQLSHVTPRREIPPVEIDVRPDGVRLRRGKLRRVLGNLARARGFRLEREDEWLVVRRGETTPPGWLLISSGDGQGRLVEMP